MTDPTARFEDLGLPLGAYAMQALVGCPSCAGPALVRSATWRINPAGTNKERATVQCLQCSFRRVRPDDVWFGPWTGYARQRCTCCGHKWLRTTLASKNKHGNPPPSVAIVCPGCGTSNTVAITWYHDGFSADPLDPTFGLPLWLQTPCCGQVLWAYNRQHISTIRMYVAASHRVRASPMKWSMLTRLPTWVKLAKHRAAVLSACDQLDQKAQRVEQSATIPTLALLPPLP